MTLYRVEVPFIADMGSITPFYVTSSPMESKEERALWEINNMRDHDGLRHIERLPKGTKFTRAED